MALLKIYTYPEKVLRKTAAPVEKVDRSVRKLMDDMAETMYEAPGIGLAANQVGLALQAVVLDIRRDEDEENENANGLITLINPQIVSATGESIHEEGCLSVPGFFANVKRAGEVVVRALNLDGETLEIHANGLLAVVLQHEIDHLHGHLFVDHMGVVARESFKRRWKKKLKEDAS